MANFSERLDRIRIATPCPVSWEQMTGTKRVRYCSHCRLNVYNVSELSRAEAELLVASTEKRICARLYRRADGTVITKDCPVGLAALTKKLSRKATAVLATVIGFSAVVFGQKSSVQLSSSCPQQTKITSQNVLDKGAILVGTVFDQNGAVIVGAEIRIKSSDAQLKRKTASNDEGKFRFPTLPEGSYSLLIKAPGFTKHEIRLRLEKSKQTNADVVLVVADPVELIGVVGEPSLIDRPPGTIILRGDVLRRLPLP